MLRNSQWLDGPRQPCSGKHALRRRWTESNACIVRAHRTVATVDPAAVVGCAHQCDERVHGRKRHVRDGVQVDQCDDCEKHVLCMAIGPRIVEVHANPFDLQRTHTPI